MRRRIQRGRAHQRHALTCNRHHPLHHWLVHIQRIRIVTQRVDGPVQQRAAVTDAQVKRIPRPDGHRKAVVQCRQRFRARDLPARRRHGQVHASHRRNPGRPGTGCIHDLPHGNALTRHRDVRDASFGITLHALHGRIPLHLHAAAPRGIEVATQDVHGSDGRIAGTPCGTDNAIHHHVRIDALRLVQRELAGLGQAGGMLDVTSGAETVQRRLVIGQEEVAYGTVLGIDADVVHESQQLCA